MAVMASPETERATSDQKPVESAPAKEESKPEANGHTSPSKTPTKSDETPAVNGNGKHDDGSKPAKSDESSTKDADAPSKESSAKPDDSSKESKPVKSDDAPKDESKEDAKSEPKEEPKVEPKVEVKDEKEASRPSSPAADESVEDIEMKDATDDEAEEKPEKKTEEKAAEASEPAKSAPDAKKDVEMTSADDKVNGTKKEAAAGSSEAAAQEVDLHPASMSQLAIDSDAKKSSSTPAASKDADVPMTEAPPAAAKVSREREDDAPDGEPVAKRARTDSKEGSAELRAAESTVEVKPQGDLAKGESALDDLKYWIDPERDPKPLTSHQTREFRKVLAGVKKTKHGAHFKDAVTKMWPGLAESYVLRVKNPMDIGELERNLRDNKYSSMRKFKDDLGLIYKNSVIFNGVNNDITLAALNVVKLAWTRVCEVPSNEPAKSKPVPKPSRHSHSEPRPAPPAQPVRRQPSVAAASPPAKAEAEAYAVPPGGVPQVRRASTQNDLDRPKRAIQPTKNRDPDYTAKNFNKKKLPVELQFCFEVLSELMDPKNGHCNMPFLHPVDPVALAIPTYFTIIKRPMDFGTIMGKLRNYDYQTTKEFTIDVKQVFKNCFKFNQPGQPVYEQGQELESIFRNLWAKKEQWIAKHTPVKPASDVSARESEDEAEEEEEEEAPAAPAETATNKTIQMLEKRLQVETENLTQLYKTADASSEPMIDLQQSVIATIRARILQEKQSLPAQKPSKGTKAKPPKPSKPKAAGAPSKKSAPAAPLKKAGGSGAKKPKQRPMTQLEKDAIATAINDLESPHIERAIDIIKKDTGQSENSSGELELEIDQLTTEALHKLWDLCKKALPNFGQGVASASAPAREPSPVSNAPSKGAKSTKPKKNKPMNAQEQEARIAELERLRTMFGKGDGDQERPSSSGRADEAPLHGDSDSSDSEEE